ncbi:hypothetical protein [Providencia hangzhouensis]|uniref:hypothetical protein n=1 Tax=Providencia hangzhouensis TaxID=3031799 RepID=UPI0034DD0382
MLPIWQKKVFSLPAGLSPVQCSTFIAHPWAVGVGQQQETGFYLSPENAIKHLSDKLSLVNSGQDVLVMMLTAKTLSEFISTLAIAALGFPLPALTQVSRQAVSYRNLATTKMQLPAPPENIPTLAPLSVSTTRLAIAAEQCQKAIQQANQPQSLDAITVHLQRFKHARETALQQVQSQLVQLQGQSFSVWVHSTEKDTQLAKTQLSNDIPDGDRVFTLAMMFIGEDLSQLRQMVKQDDHNTDG